MKTLTELLLLFVLIYFFRKSIKSKKKDVVVVKEVETNNIIRPKSKIDITNDYFLMRLDEYIKRTYGEISSWEFVCGGSGIKYTIHIHDIRIIFPNGKEKRVHIHNDDIWGQRNPYEEPKEPIKEELKSVPTVPVTEQITEFLLKHSAEIYQTIEDAMEKGEGFFAYYAVKEKDLSDSFMKDVAKRLEENTGYDVSYKNNVLEIGFQNMI